MEQEDYRKQKTMPLSSQSEDKEVHSSKRQGYYDESESALSPPVDSQISQKDIEIPSHNQAKLNEGNDNDDEEDYSDDAEF